MPVLNPALNRRGLGTLCASSRNSREITWSPARERFFLPHGKSEPGTNAPMSGVTLEAPRLLPVSAKNRIRIEHPDLKTPEPIAANPACSTMVPVRVSFLNSARTFIVMTSFEWRLP